MTTPDSKKPGSSGPNKTPPVVPTRPPIILVKDEKIKPRGGRN